MACEACHRCLRDHRKHFRQWPAHLGLDCHHRVLGQVADHRVGPRHAKTGLAAQAPRNAVDPDVHAVKHQFPGQLRQARPAIRRVGQKTLGNVGQGGIAHLSGDMKLALFGGLERHVVQIALHPHLDRTALPAQHRLAHIVARILHHHQGQVAINPFALDAIQLGLQIEHAGEAPIRAPWPLRASMPTALGLALPVGVGKTQFWKLNRYLVALDAPTQLRCKLIEGQVGVFEYPRQDQRAALHGKLGVPISLVGFEFNIQPTHARCADLLVHPLHDGARQRRQLQAAHAAAQVEPARRRVRSPPAELQFVQYTLGVMPRQRLARGTVQRQMPRNAGQRRDLQPVGVQLPTGLLPNGLAVLEG